MFVAVLVYYHSYYLPVGVSSFLAGASYRPQPVRVRCARNFNSFFLTRSANTADEVSVFPSGVCASLPTPWPLESQLSVFFFFKTPRRCFFVCGLREYCLFLRLSGLTVFFHPFCPYFVCKPLPNMAFLISTAFNTCLMPCPCAFPYTFGVYDPLFPLSPPGLVLLLRSSFPCC